MSDNVIQLRPPPGPPADDPLLSLPECPVQACGKCGKSCEEAGGWISTTGCMACLSVTEQALVMEVAGATSRASVLAGELERLLVAARAVTHTNGVKVAAIQELKRVVVQIDDNERRVPMRSTPNGGDRG